MNWIPVTFNANTKPEIRDLQDGVRVNVLVSPYDIPEAVRGYLAPDQKTFIIEFKYISSEDFLEQVLEPGVVIAIGRNSKRLYAIKLTVKAFQTDKVRLRLGVAETLSNAMTHLIEAPISEMREKNYRLAKDVIDKNESLLLQTV